MHDLEQAGETGFGVVGCGETHVWVDCVRREEGGEGWVGGSAEGEGWSALGWD